MTLNFSISNYRNGSIIQINTKEVAEILHSPLGVMCDPMRTNEAL